MADFRAPREGRGLIRDGEAAAAEKRKAIEKDIKALRADMRLFKGGCEYITHIDRITDANYVKFRDSCFLIQELHTKIILAHQTIEDALLQTDAGGQADNLRLKADVIDCLALGTRASTHILAIWWNRAEQRESRPLGLEDRLRATLDMHTQATQEISQLAGKQALSESEIAARDEIRALLDRVLAVIDQLPTFEEPAR